VKRRGDSDSSVDKRVRTIPVEALSWRTLVREQGATEITRWPFPEYRFKGEDGSQLLREARKTILDRDPTFEVFFKKEGQIAWRDHA